MSKARDAIEDLRSIATVDDAQTFTAKPTFGAGVDVTGNVAVTGLVDGRDVAADGVTLDGMEAYVDTGIAALVDSSPAALDTLNELAAALGDDPNFATTVNNSIATKLPLAGGTMTGVIAGFESTGIDDNATSTAVTVDSSGNVGIGTSPSTHKVEVLGSNNIAKFYSSATATELKINAPTVNVIGLYTGTADALVLGTADTERMRIDSLGNVLVGKSTLDGTGSRGLELRADGLLLASKAGQPMSLDRTGSDGTIAGFYKDGAIVGSIGYGAGVLGIGQGTGNLGLFNATVIPMGSTSGAASDGVITLGSSARRFKDAYLSGGVYLGGTGAANKLDDYEEGTWTPTQGTFTTWTSPTFTATYTKVGRMITVNLKQTGGTVAASSGAKYIGGLPFSGTLQSVGSVSDGGIVNLGNAVTWSTSFYCTDAIASTTSLMMTATYYV